MRPVPAGYPIERLSGPLIIAFLLHWGLFGTLSMQLYLYYLAFPKDRKITKYLVYGVYIVEFVQTMLFTHDAFAMFGYGFGDIKALVRMNFNWLTIPIMTAAVAFVGQVFYAYRIFILSKSRVVPIFIICVSLTSSVAGIITGVYGFQADDITELNNLKMYIAVGILCGASALCDIIIAICMTYYLQRSTTGFRSTQMVVMKLIRLTVETGSVTAVVALLSFILFFAFPHQTFYGTPSIIIPKLYANAVLMVLNSRIRIVGGRDTDTSSADMTITTTMIKDITSQLTESTRPTDGMQGHVSMLALTKEEALSDDAEMSLMREKPQEVGRSLAA
ncbi:hypothetical protein ARMGADRAFT_1086385 [Armillaria gallica]|uniref:DUF6534 domain-containing protein n=1 Tax=Armillaria gallica TaxID=47427 RepID=A0A2H3DBT0_ARMGA|nr:hypothetical protein ARMGADRAFT_1086385 [Armillaria gallica]